MWVIKSQAVSNTWIVLKPLHVATVPQQSVTEIRRSETLISASLSTCGAHRWKAAKTLVECGKERIE